MRAHARRAPSARLIDCVSNVCRVTLPPDLHRALLKMAEREQRSVGNAIAVLVTEALLARKRRQRRRTNVRASELIAFPDGEVRYACRPCHEAEAIAGRSDRFPDHTLYEICPTTGKAKAPLPKARVKSARRTT